MDELKNILEELKSINGKLTQILQRNTKLSDWTPEWKHTHVQHFNALLRGTRLLLPRSLLLAVGWP